MKKKIDLDKLYKKFTELLNSFTKKDLEKWLKFDEKRLKESKKEKSKI